MNNPFLSLGTLIAYVIGESLPHNNPLPFGLLRMKQPFLISLLSQV